MGEDLSVDDPSNKDGDEHTAYGKHDVGGYEVKEVEDGEATDGEVGQRSEGEGAQDAEEGDEAHGHGYGTFARNAHLLNAERDAGLAQ